MKMDINEYLEGFITELYGMTKAGLFTKCVRLMRRGLELKQKSEEAIELLMAENEALKAKIEELESASYIEEQKPKRKAKTFKTAYDLEFVEIMRALKDLKIKGNLYKIGKDMMDSAYPSCKDDKNGLIRRDAAYAIAAGKGLIKL